MFTYLKKIEIALKKKLTENTKVYTVELRER